MTKPSDRFGGDGSPFPQVVAWLGLALALLLFFGNTVPAVRERKELRATADELAQLRTRYDAAIAHAMGGTPGGAGPQDLQSVLVAIDRIGWTPSELMHCYPEPLEPQENGASRDGASRDGASGDGASGDGPPTARRQD